MKSPRLRYGSQISPAHYLILERPVTIESDSPEFLAIFDRDYAAFRTGTPLSDNPLHFSVMVAPGGDPHLRVRETRGSHPMPELYRSFADHPHPPSAAYRLLLRELFNALHGFIILHAGVVKADNAALLLAGPPGVGKTTLTLSLLEAGLAFFSDDFCPIDRATRLVHPYPRSAWVVGRRADRGAGVRPGKQPLPTETIAASAKSWQPCRPRWVVILDPGDRRGETCVLEMGVKADTRQPLMQDLERLGAGLRLESSGPGQCVIRVHYPSAAGLTAGVRRILERHQGGILEAFRDDAVRPEYDRTPVLEPISPHEAAFSLLGDLKQLGVDGSGVEALAESPARLLMELVGLLEGADCRRLTVGRLGQTRDLLLGLTKPAPAGSRSDRR